MHEYGLVQTLLDRATEEAHSRGAIKVHQVNLAIGELSGVEPELLQLAWETFRERTVCDGARLSLRFVPARWSCPRCKRPFRRGDLLRCSECSLPARLDEGDDLVLERLELEIPDHV